MKKQTRSLVIVIILLVLLVGAFLLFINKEEKPGVDDNSEISEDMDKSVTLWDFNINNLKSINVKNELDEYEIIKKQDKYEIEQLKDLPLIEENFTFLDEIYKLDASSKIENPESLKEYGLENPNIIITLVNNDEEIKVNIGNLVPDKSSYYITLNNENNIFIVNKSFVSNFLYDKFHYLDKSLTDEILQTVSADITSLVIGGSSQNGEDMVFEPVIHDADDIYSAYRAGHVLTNPVNHDVKIEKMSTLLESIFALKAQEIEIIYPTEEDFEKYGLKTPLITVKGSYIEILEEQTEEKEVKTPAEGNIDYIIGSKTEDGKYYYAMKTGVSIVYKVSSADVFYVDEKYTDYMNAMLLVPYIFDVKTIDVEFLDNSITEKNSYNFEHFVIEEEVKTEGEPTKRVFEKVLINDNEVDSEVYKKVYQILISVRGETAATKEIIEEFKYQDPAFTIKYNYFDENKKPDEVKLIKINDRTVLVVINDETHFTMRNVYITKLYEAIALLQNGETVTSTEW